MTAMVALALLVQGGATMELGRGPIATTTVAVTVTLDAEGRVLTCRTPSRDTIACRGFPKGRVVSAPLRRGGRPVRGKMTVSTTTVVSAL